MPRKTSHSYRLERNTRWLIRRRDGLLRRLGRIGPFVDGSIYRMGRTCGNKEHCRCSRGKKHVSSYLMFKVRQKSRTLYIPVDLLGEVLTYSKRYRSLKELIRQICDVQKEIVRRHVQEKARHHHR